MCQGCRLPPDGDRRAASRIARTVDSGTGVGRNARQLMRVSTASVTFTCFPPVRNAILAGFMSRSYKILLLSSLYLAQGLPYGFFTQALPVLLRDAGYSLKAISATSLLFLPWALKFLWAPFVDHRGTRKSWLLPLQCAGVAGALLLSRIDLGTGLVVLLVAAFLFNLVAACQDIATDGLAVRILDPRERGLANGIQVGAYRIGMILGGGLLLWVFAKSGWATMFACMAALLALTVIPVLPLREPPRV